MERIRTKRDEQGLLSEAIRETIPSFRTSDGHELPVEGHVFVVTAGPRGPKEPYAYSSEAPPFENYGKALGYAVALDEAGTKDVRVVALPKDRVKAQSGSVTVDHTTELEPVTPSSTNGHSIDFGFHGSLRDDPPGL